MGRTIGPKNQPTPGFLISKPRFQSFSKSNKQYVLRSFFELSFSLSFSICSVFKSLKTPYWRRCANFLLRRYIPIQNSCATTSTNKKTATTAKPLSTSLIAGADREARRRGAIGGAGRGGAEGTEVLLGTAEGAAGSFWVAAAVREAGAAGADGAGLAPIAGDGAGIFTVAAAVGFGGRLIRTVSFFG